MQDSAIFRDKIENYFSCSHLARRDRDYHMTILVSRDKNEITYCYSHVSRRDRDFRKSFLVVERENWSWLSSRIPGIENSRWPLMWSSRWMRRLITNVKMTLWAVSMHGCCPPRCQLPAMFSQSFTGDDGEEEEGEEEGRPYLWTNQKLLCRLVQSNKVFVIYVCMSYLSSWL